MKKEQVYKKKINKAEKLLRELDFMDAMGLCTFILVEGIRMLKEKNEYGIWNNLKESIIDSLESA
jgi:hypothetical protein